MKTKSVLSAVLVLITSAFVLLLSGVCFADISFGPATAVKKVVKEYNDKVREDRIANKGEWIGDGGTVTGVIRKASGDSVTNSGPSIYVDGVYKANADYSGGSYSIGVTPGKPVKIKATRWVNGSNSESTEYTVTAAKGQTVAQDICFPWNVQPSSLKTTNNQIEDAKLTAANSPYSVDGNFNCTGLCIEPGVTIKFSGSYGFQAFGTVYASGTASAPIIFTSGRSSPGTGDYNEVTIGGSSMSTEPTVYLNYVKFEYGSAFTISGSTSSEVYNCTVSSTNNSSLNLYLNGTVKYCDFVNTTAWTYISISGTPKISYCNIKNQISINSGAGEGIKINKCNLTKNAAGSSYIIENSANRDIDAGDNWWGSSNVATINGYIGGTYKNRVNSSTPAPLTGAISTCGPQ